MIAGRAFVFGDGVDTDVLAPGVYMKLPIEQLAQHCLESVDPDFVRNVRPGDIVVAGVNFGLALQMSAVALGLSWIVDLFARHFDLIRYAGAAYLAILGIQQLLAKRPEASGEVPVLRGDRAFLRGLAVAFANPKTLIFHAAFLPQFVTPDSGGP